MIYVASDLHGCLEEWQTLLRKIRFSDKDTMFVLGDSVDFGPDPIGLLHDMMGRANVFSVLGNHEVNFVRCVRGLPPEADMKNLSSYISDDKKSLFAEWMANGGQTTLAQYLALDESEREDIIDYIGEMTLFEEAEADGVEFILTHAGLSNFDPERPLDDYSPEEFLSASPKPGDEYFEDKTVIVGHVPTFRLDGGEAGKILDDGAIIYIDCGAAHPSDGGGVGCLCLDDFETYYA